MSCIYSYCFIGVFKVEVFDVDHEAFCSFGQENTVQKYFEEEHVRCWGAAVVWVFFSLSSSGELSSPFFVFVGL
jgi:hypothetical protein